MMDSTRAAGNDESSGTKAEPDLTMPRSAIRRSMDRPKCAATGTSGPTPSRFRWRPNCVERWSSSPNVICSSLKIAAIFAGFRLHCSSMALSTQRAGEIRRTFSRPAKYRARIWSETRTRCETGFEFICGSCTRSQARQSTSMSMISELKRPARPVTESVIASLPLREQKEWIRSQNQLILATRNGRRKECYSPKQSGPPHRAERKHTPASYHLPLAISVAGFPPPLSATPGPNH